MASIFYCKEPFKRFDSFGNPPSLIYNTNKKYFTHWMFYAFIDVISQS